MKLARAPFASRQFRLLFTGELISFLRTAVAPVAIAFAVLDLTGSATDLGLVLAAGWLPQIVFVLVGGVLGDRLPRHLVMVGANLLAAAGQATSAALLLTSAAPQRTGRSSPRRAPACSSAACSRCAGARGGRSSSARSGCCRRA